MFISMMHIDAFEGYRDMSYDVPDPEIGQIETAIRRLDGNGRSLVILSADNGISMGVGGGNAGKYYVSITYDDGDGGNYVARPSNVVSNPNRTGIIPIVIGGQAVEHSLDDLIDLDDALRATTIFATRGIRDPILRWEAE